MATAPDVLEFDRSDPERLVERIDRISGRGDGSGWINLGPALSDDEFAAVPHRSGLGAWFSGRGPAVPMATWTPPVTGRKHRAAQLGVAHGTGPNALSRLADEGCHLPPGWVKRQDHAKHGIVVELPDDLDVAAMVDWVVRALAGLSPLLSTGDRWIAEIHEPG